MIKPEALASLIKNCAPEAYFVGGAVRDALLKRYCGDIDLAMPRELVKPCAVKLAAKLKASAFEMDPDFCVWRVTAKSGLQIDLCAFVGKDIKADLKRRDFTINAMAYNEETGLVDAFGGIHDIENKIIYLKKKNNCI